VPDSNDIPFNEYSLDFFAFIDFAWARLSGSFSGGAQGGGEFSVGGWTPGAVFDFLSGLWSFMVVLSWLVSALLLFGLIYAYLRHSQLGDVLAELLKRQEEAYVTLHRKDVKNQRWRDVMTHIDSERPNDWKLAIIEADIILDELLNMLGYTGTSIGEKLKSVSPNSFKTINQAWRAHNTRNRVAHEGADFDLSKRAAKETITEYQMVFEEFDFV
jgi:hypothetical protein